MNSDYTPDRMIRDVKMLSCLSVAASMITLIFMMWALTASGEFSPNKDPITFSLALLQTFIALGAFAGFWVIRSSAKESAKDAARETVSQYVKTSEFEALLLKEILEPEVMPALTGRLNLGSTITMSTMTAQYQAEMMTS